MPPRPNQTRTLITAAVSVVRPLRVVLACPVLAHRAESHPAQRMSRLRIDQRQVEVTADEEDRGYRETVVQQERARPAEVVVPLAVPEQESRDDEQQRERGRQGGVQLLAGALNRPCGAE